jgi:hypothetical protein
MRTRKHQRRLGSAFVAAALAAGMVAAAPPPAETAAASGLAAVPISSVPLLEMESERPHTRMYARATGPLAFSFFVRPKLAKGKNWRYKLRVKECGRNKEWVTVQKGRTKGRSERIDHSGMKVIRKLKRDDGKFSGVRAYRLITPKQRGHDRTVKTFRNYPLDDAGFIRIGVC